MGFQESQHLAGLQIRVYWLLEEQDNTKLSSDFESDISNNAKRLMSSYKHHKSFSFQSGAKYVVFEISNSGKIAGGELSVILIFLYSELIDLLGKRITVHSQRKQMTLQKIRLFTNK